MPRRRKISIGWWAAFGAVLLLALWLRPGASQRAERAETKNSAGKLAADVEMEAVALPPGEPATETGAQVSGEAAARPALWRVVAVAGDPAALPLLRHFAVPATAEQVERAARVELQPADISGWQAGDEIALPLLDGRVARGRVNLVQREPGGRVLVGGRVLDDGGAFSLGVNAGAVSGTILPAEGAMAYVLQAGRDGQTYLLEKQRGFVVCATLPAPGATAAGGLPPAVVNALRQADTRTAASLAGGPASGGAGGGNAALAAVVSPTFDAVLYLDFDGETVTDPFWNRGTTVVAEPSGLDAAQIDEVLRRVAEDYRPFKIEVTADRARYDAARPNQRMRCIVTTTSDWMAPGIAGIAKLFSWSEAGVQALRADVPCWIFADRFSPFNLTQNLAFAISHEAGHTFGLSHDGLSDDGLRFSERSPAEQAKAHTEQEYYSGRVSGATSWGPIMGAPYDREVTQWNNGDYTDSALLANNHEDDLALIADIGNHTGFRDDDAGDTTAEASALVAPGVTAVNVTGAIGRTGETDMFVLAAGGSVTLGVADDTTGTGDDWLPNLDAKLTLYDSGGAVVTTANPAGVLTCSLSATLAPGIYYVGVTGTGNGTLATGYSNYGSLGRYHLVGTLGAATGLAPVVRGLASATATAGAAFVYQIQAAGNPTDFLATGLPPGLACDSATGAITGTPTTAGVYAVTLEADNVTGSGTRPLQLTVLPATLAEAADAPTLTFTTGGDAPWRVDGVFKHTGIAAARSGVIMNDGKQSWLQTTFTVSGQLSFWWKVSSETYPGDDTPYDILHFTVDGVEQAMIAGEKDWAHFTALLPTGTHTVRWTYTKDPYASIGEDAGWVDGVEFVPGSFTLWAQGLGLAGADAALAADPDGDGLSNLLEYALGLDPLTPGVPVANPAGTAGLADSAGVPAVTTVSVAGATRLDLTFIRPPNRPDLTYTVEVSGDLVTWTPGHAYGPGVVNGAGLPTQEMERTVLADGSERIRVRDMADGGATRRFMRVRVTVP